MEEKVRKDTRNKINGRGLCHDHDHGHRDHDDPMAFQIPAIPKSQCQFKKEDTVKTYFRS